MSKNSIKKAVLLRRARRGCGCKGNSGFSPIQTPRLRSPCAAKGAERRWVRFGGKTAALPRISGCSFLQPLPQGGRTAPVPRRAASAGSLQRGILILCAACCAGRSMMRKKNEHRLGGDGKPSERFAGGTVCCFVDAYTGWGCLECGGLYFLCVVIESFSPTVGTAP